MNKDQLRKISAVEDHNRSFQQFHYVYPVISRRSKGLSIGINLNPDKVCNFNCIYCEVDRNHCNHKNSQNILSLDILKQELESLLIAAQNGQLAKDEKFADTGDLTYHIKDIAFSGDGEPTLSLFFPETVEIAVHLKQKFNLTQTKLVLITNATCLHRLNIQDILPYFFKNQGEIWAKLDAGTEDYYRKINQSKVPFVRVLENLKQAAQSFPIYIQTMFLKLNGDVMSSEEILAYCKRLKWLAAGGNILGIQAYTIARRTFGTKEGDKLSPLTKAELEAVGETINKQTGLSVECFF